MDPHESSRESLLEALSVIHDIALYLGNRDGISPEIDHGLESIMSISRYGFVSIGDQDLKLYGIKPRGTHGEATGSDS